MYWVIHIHAHAKSALSSYYKEYILIKYDSLLSDIFINDDNIKILHDKYNSKLKAVVY